MRRTTQLVVAAGIAGAVFATVLGQLFISTPVVASSDWTIVQARTATVDVLMLLERMLEMDPYLTERNAEQQRWNDVIMPLVDQRDAALQSLQTMDQTNPDQAAGQALYEQYQGLAQRINQLGQQAQQELDKLSARQLASAYEQIHTAAKEIAEAEGFDRVFSSRMSATDLNAENTNVVVQEVLLRPLMLDTTATDMTPMIIEKLAIPELAPAVEQAPVLEGPAGVEPAADPDAQPVTDPAAGTGGG